MGEEFSRAPGPAAVAARAVGTAPIARLEIVSEGKVVHVQHGGGRVAALECDLPVDTGTGSPDNDGGGMSAGQTRYFYLRVTQTDGQTAWSSPVWVTVSGS
jgi:hypothetical protein